MRTTLATLALPIAIGCAGGGMGATSTSVGVSSSVTAVDDGTASESGTTSESADTSGTETTAAGTGTSSGTADETGIGGSSETGEPLPCDAALESFAADPAWTVFELPHDGNAFGWVGTQLAGGDPGEIGGTLQRTNTALWYADTAIAIAAGDCVSASGVLAATMRDADYNTGVSFGHFSTAGGIRIGFHLGEANDGMLRVFMIAGGFEEQVFLMDAAGVSREWSYAYDPAEGTMSLSIDGFGGVTRPVDATAVAGMDAIDAFGISIGVSDNASESPGLLGLYLDEITYTR